MSDKALEDALADHDTATVGADAVVNITGDDNEIADNTITPADVIQFDFPRPEKRRVAIVGFATGHAHLAPFDDETTEVWGINQLWKLLPDRRFTRWFELHDLDAFYSNNPDHIAFLQQFAGPVYVREQDYALALEWGIDTAQPFPHKVLLEQFMPYFNNTISWLIALAIMMTRTWPDDRFEWMGLWGIDMAQDTLLQAEYASQRPSAEYFIGIATGIGIEVFIPHGSDMLKTSHLYGYEDSGPVLEKMGSRFQELGLYKEKTRGEVGQLEAQIAAKRAQVSELDGAMQEVSFWRKIWLTLPAGNGDGP